jgi:hypothetical protein
MSLSTVRVCGCFVFALLIVFASPLPAQTTTGTMRGQVTDTLGAPLPGVTVTIRNVDTGQQRVVVTNEAGLYNAPFLPVGRYEVTAGLQGLGTQTRRGVELALNQTADQNFIFGLAVAERVTVMAEQPRINTVNASITQSMDAQQVIDKPVPPQQGPTAFLNLAETFAGFSENPTAGQNNPTSSSGSSVNFGAGTRGATFQINGVNNDDSSENQHRQGVALSTIKEFQILTNNYSAEFGRGYGAVVLVQTKSGTNQFNGDVYGFLAKAEWNEKRRFAEHLAKPQGERMIMGVTSGFPIVRDRLFGYVSGEKNEFTQEGSDVLDIFTPELLALPRLTLGNDTPENRAWQDKILGYYPQVQPNDPRSPQTYSALVAADWPDEDYSARLDFDLHVSHHLNARYQDSAQTRFTEELMRGENAIQDNAQQNFGLSYTHIISSNVVGEFLYGLGIRQTHVNIAAGNDTPIVRFTASPVASTILGNAGAFPINRDQTDNQFVYNLSALLFANHSLKIGTDIRRQELDDLADNYSRGFWTFNRVCGGVTYESPYHAFMAGCVRTFWKGWGNFFLENRLSEENLYAEDNWQIFNNLTLNLGVRYERVGAPEEARDRLDYQIEDTSHVDPRLGFAYTIGGGNRFLDMITGGSGRSVIRGGYGHLHGRVFQSVFSQGGINMRFNPPNALFRSDFTNSTNLADPTEGFIFTPAPLTGTPRFTGTFVSVDPNLEMPMTAQWNLTFEREMPWNSSMRLSYTNKAGENLIRYWNDNLPLSPLNGPVLVVDHPNNAPGQVGIPAGQPDLRGKVIDTINPDPCAGTGMPGVPTTPQCPVPVPLADNEISFRVPRYTQRRPDPRFATISQVAGEGESEYESVQLQWVKRFSQGLHFQASYTWSEYFDNVSEATFVGAGDTNATGPNRRFAWGRSRFDTPHRFTLYGSYTLPFFEGRKDLVGILLGGWQVTPVVKYVSGSPFTVTDSGGIDLDLNITGELRPVILNPSIEGSTIGDPATSQQRLPRDAFRRATWDDTVDDLTGRNAFRTDDLRQVDLGLYKNFSLPWGDTLTLRIESYNIFDEVQYGIPVTDIAAANFGAILGTSVNYQPRTYQLGLRYVY